MNKRIKCLPIKKKKTFFLIGKTAEYIEKIGRIQSIKDILYLRSKFKLKHHINIYLFLLSAYFPNHLRDYRENYAPHLNRTAVYSDYKGGANRNVFNQLTVKL